MGKSSIARMLSLVLFCSCTSYKAGVMFSAATSSDNDWLKKERFTVRAGDEIEMTLAPWEGEQLLVDEEQREASSVLISIDQEGIGRFPMIGTIALEGKSLIQLDSILTDSYAKFIKNPFIRTRFLNKRAVVIGTVRTEPVTLPFENIRLTEVIARTGGFLPETRLDNVRVVRGENYFIADLTNATDRWRNDIFIQPGDVIYVEPMKKVVKEGIRDVLPIVSTLTSIISVAALLLTLL